MVSGIRTWLTFCVYYNLEYLPATAGTLVPFLQLKSLTVTYGHLKHLMSAIKFYHQAKNVAFPEHDFDVNNTLHGLKRELSHTVFQALPLTPAIMRGMFAHLDMSKPKDLSLWCSYLVTFYCLFRKSNSVPKSGKTFNVKRLLMRKHIRVDKDNNMVYVHVTFSKTIHFGQRDLVIPIPGNEDAAMDPVRHLDALFSRCPCPAESPAFSFSKDKCITYAGFTTSLKQLLGMILLSTQATASEEEEQHSFTSWELQSSRYRPLETGPANVLLDTCMCQRKRDSRFRLLWPMQFLVD